MVTLEGAGRVVPQRRDPALSRTVRRSSTVLRRIDMRDRIQHAYHGRVAIHPLDHRLVFVAMPEITVDPPSANQGNELHMPTYETETVSHALQAAGAVHSRDN